eukprot:scaffold16242_cov55-Attheya_sp.AAC.5
MTDLEFTRDIGDSDPLSTSDSREDSDVRHAIVVGPTPESRNEQHTDTWIMVRAGIFALVHVSCVVGSYVGPWTDTLVSLETVNTDDNSIWRTIQTEFGTQTGHGKRSRGTQISIWVSGIVSKWALGIIFLEALLGIATTVTFTIAGSLGGDGTGSALLLSVHNIIRGGLISYLLGTTAGILVLVTLAAQFSRYNTLIQSHQSSSGNATITSQGASLLTTPRSQNTVRPRPNATPPGSAFQFTWHKGEGNIPGPLMSPLLEQSQTDSFTEDVTSQDFALSSALSFGPHGNPLMDAYRGRNTSVPRHVSQTPVLDDTTDEEIPFWPSFLIFECSLLAGILCIPMYTLPLIRLTYTGMGAEFMTSPTITDLHLLDISRLIWSYGWRNGSAGWIVIVTGGLFVATVLIVPVMILLLSLVLCVASYDSLWLRLTRLRRLGLGKESWTKRSVQHFSHYWIQQLYPLANNAVFAVTLFAVAGCLPQVSKFLFDQNEICSFLDKSIFGECLLIDGTAMTGAWCCLLQGITSEVLMILILWKLAPKE